MSDLAPELREVAVTLPDGGVRRYPAGTTAAAIAADISKSLGKAALAARIDGRLADLSQPIDQDAGLAIVTAADAAPALELIRHDAAHIMAEAVQELLPGDAGHHRPGDRERLLLRLRPRRAVHAGRPRRRSKKR